MLLPNSTTHALAVALFWEVEAQNAVGGGNVLSVRFVPATMPVPLVTVKVVPLVTWFTTGGVT